MWQNVCHFFYCFELQKEQHGTFQMFCRAIIRRNAALFYVNNNVDAPSVASDSCSCPSAEKPEVDRKLILMGQYKNNGLAERESQWLVNPPVTGKLTVIDFLLKLGNYWSGIVIALNWTILLKVIKYNNVIGQTIYIDIFFLPNHHLVLTTGCQRSSFSCEILLINLCFAIRCCSLLACTCLLPNPLDPLGFFLPLLRQHLLRLLPETDNLQRRDSVGGNFDLKFFLMHSTYSTTPLVFYSKALFPLCFIYFKST